MLYQGRIDRFDILKGIGIILVLLGHSNIGDIPHLLIYCCHMSVFFFASGFFYKHRTIKEELAISAKRILVPFLFFLALWTIENVSLAIVSGEFGSVSNYLSNYHVLDENCSFLYASIWFLLALFFVRVLYTILNQVIKHDWLLIMVSLFLYLMGYTLHAKGINIPLFIDTSFSVTIYYCLGHMFKKSGKYVKKLNWWYYVIALAFYMAICLLLYPITDLKKNIFPIYSIILSIGGCSALYQLSYELEKRGSSIANALKYLGCISLSIFGLHRLFFKLIYIILGKLEFQGIIINILVVIITIACIIPIDKLLTKYCPTLLGKSNK